MMRGVLVVILLVSGSTVAKKAPNIIFFLTDDQDVVLGGALPKHNGVTPIPKAESRLQHQGTTATNYYIHTPICCPSRSETLTGRYLHNVKKVHECPEGYNGHDSNGYTCCMHVDEVLVNNFTMANYLKEGAGYKVGMFGKYLNNCPEHPPPGFDAWFANGGGTYYSPTFSVAGIDGLPNGTWHGTKEDYTTSVVGNRSLEWIRKVAGQGDPFLAYIAPKACHEPFLPAPWYKDYWDPSWPPTAPRPPSFNISYAARAHHHPTIQKMDYPLTTETVQCIDDTFKNRWRTLMSVDDVISAVLDLTDELGITDETYFMYSSDHGFQLGELNLPMDKRNTYEFDIKIHLTLRGPGIKPGTPFDFLASNVDIAPTILGMAGIPKPPTMDGKSYLPLLINKNDPNLPETVLDHLVDRPPEIVAASWRKSIYIEYYYVGIDAKCGMKNPIERPDNNFIALRHLDGPYGNVMYAEFQDDTKGFTTFDKPVFYEMYDMDKDPWQLINLYNTTAPSVKQALHEEVHRWLQCKGDTCP